MGYYLRVFCVSDEIPPLAEALARSEGDVELRLDPGHAPADANAVDWRDAAVLYDMAKQPFIVEATRAADGDLLAEEVEEFLDLLENVPDSPEKAKVADHLRRARAVVAAQVLGDADDDGGDGLAAAANFLLFFAERCDGLIQADGTGFFEGDDLILEVD